MTPRENAEFLQLCRTIAHELQCLRTLRQTEMHSKGISEGAHYNLPPKPRPPITSEDLEDRNTPYAA